MSGQTLTDRIAAAQYQLTGSDMARAVCKATTHEVMAPKKKHLECKCGLSSSFLLHELDLHGLGQQAAYTEHIHPEHMPSLPEELSHHHDQSFLRSLSSNGCGAVMN